MDARWAALKFGSLIRTPKVGDLSRYYRSNELAHIGPHAGRLDVMSHTATCDLDPNHAHEKPDLDRRARRGVRAVGLSLGILGLTAAAQAAIFLFSGSVALLADLIHNVGDAVTAVPLGLAFVARSVKAERYSGMAVVVAIFVSGVVAGISAVEKLINPYTPRYLAVLAVAGAVGVVGNGVAARVRTRAGRELDSPALIADGHHAKVDALVSAGVVLSAAGVGLGFPVIDPLIALVITGVIGHIVWDAWKTVTIH